MRQPPDTPFHISAVPSPPDLSFSVPGKLSLKSVLITGGAGYVGTLLVPQLLDAGYNVVVYDTMYYACELKPVARLKLLQADVRDTPTFRIACKDIDAVINLACISYDSGFDLD